MNAASHTFSYPLSHVHAQESGEVVAALASDSKRGLPEREAEERLRQFGANVIREKKNESAFLIFLYQFKGPFVILLVLAAGLSFWFREWLDGIAILIVLLANAVIGFFMEYKAERSMEALRRLTKIKAKVLREGKLKEVISDSLVPGDILVAEAGDMVLADAR